MHELYIEFFYRHSILEMLSWGLLLVGLWIVIALLLRNHQTLWRAINLILLIIVSVFILDRTLIGRGSKRELQLLPFYSFVAAKSSPERIRSLVANLLLFIPFGLSLPFVLRSKGKKTGKPISKTIIIAFLFSFFIELSQYAFALGLCETDDIIFNTLGAAEGAFAFAIVHRIENK